jgi:hypothetical protein
MEVEKEMEYQYDKNDLITNPQKYQKTMFLGNNFLNTYKESREKVIKKISVNEKKINFNKNKDVRIILKKEKFDVEELLAAILNNKNKLDLENNKIIDKLLKKFEIKKRICNKINNKFEEKDNEYNNLKNYLLLSKLILIKYNETENLKFLNTVLKINDTICSQIKKLKNDSDKILLKEIIEEELDIINNICNKNGVKF